MYTLAVLCASLLVLPVYSQEDHGAKSLLQRFDADRDGKLDQTELQRAVESQGTESDQPKSDLEFLRVRRDKRDQPVSLDTSIVSFKSATSGLRVDLIGAVHVADQRYYEDLNRQFKEYDVVLYELVAPTGTRVPKGGGGSRHPVGRMQQAIKSMLDLSFQLDHIDYQRPNLVHADMSPEEFAKSMKDRNESFVELLFRMMGQAAAKQASQDGPSDFDLLFALFSNQRALKLKRILATQFEDLETQMNIIEGPQGSTLISERNKKALAVLREQADSGKKRIAIFYGAGHMPDIARRLETDFGLKPYDQKWIAAWDMSGGKKEGKSD
jgi:hypothetical protein